MDICGVVSSSWSAMSVFTDSEASLSTLASFSLGTLPVHRVASYAPHGQALEILGLQFQTTAIKQVLHFDFPVHTKVMFTL